MNFCCRAVIAAFTVLLAGAVETCASVIHHPRFLERSFFDSHTADNLLSNARTSQSPTSSKRPDTTSNTSPMEQFFPNIISRNHNNNLTVESLSLPGVGLALLAQKLQQIGRTSPLLRIPKFTKYSCGTLVLSCMIACKAFPVMASASASPHTTHKHRSNPRRSTKMTAFEVVSRSVRFWIQATPIIVHYQFTNAYLTAHPKLRKIPTYTDTDNVIDDDTPKKKKAFLHQPLTKQEIDILRERRQQRRDEIYRNLHETYSPRTLALLLEMRGLFVKIGQVLSSRPDFMPQQYIDQLQSLQDDVPPLNEDEIMDIVREFIWNDHGLDLDEFFEEGKFDGLLGTASIGQVHKATLTQNVYDKIVKENGYKGGRVVAVKVMHHDAEDRFRNDFKILKWLCRLALPGWTPLLQELERQMMTEFDYNNEAANLNAVRKNMIESPYAKKVQVPYPITSYTSQHVLIMEYLDGVKLEKAVENSLVEALNGDQNIAKSLIQAKRKELFDGTVTNSDPMKDFKQVQSAVRHFPLHTKFRTVFKLVYLQWKQMKTIQLLLELHGHQILNNGIFNGDPHPGNILMLSNGKLGLIDYGQCKRLDADQRLALRRVVSELSSPTVDNKAVQHAMHNMGFRFENGNEGVICETARLFFDSDRGMREAGFANPQFYFRYLQKLNATLIVPDEAVFVARTSFLFRGMGALLGNNVETSKSWSKVMLQ